MKIKVAELEGAKLDYWVGVSCGLMVEVKNGVCFRETSFGKHEYHPSSDWSQGGPIIEREGITICPAHPKGWSATIDDERWEDDCATPLIAAMRAFVYSKFGEEVEE